VIFLSLGVTKSLSVHT